MIRLLKRFADWLDNRFPAKFHVTDAIFQDLLRRETDVRLHLNTLAASIESLSDRKRTMDANIEARIDAMESTISAVREFVNKSEAPAAAAAARRAAFIADGRMPE